jgi:hypothetical protein
MTRHCYRYHCRGSLREWYRRHFWTTCSDARNALTMARDKSVLLLLLLLLLLLRHMLRW